MFIPLILIALVAPLGAIDVLYFHIWKFKLYKQPSSRMEMITHLARAILFATGAGILFFFEPRGAWYWIVGAIFLLDFINSVADVSLEKNSRAPFGGVPTLEYIIHTIGSTFAGAITTAFLILGWPYQSLPTELAPVASGSLPGIFTLLGWQFVIIGFALTVVEGILYFQSFSKRTPIKTEKDR